MDRSWGSYWGMDGSFQPEPGPSDGQGQTFDPSRSKDESGPVAETQRPPNKRKRLVHPNHAELGACASAIPSEATARELTHPLPSDRRHL